jgi:sugar (pentulose or hexulose) kinase
MATPVTAIFDIGKTNKKFYLFDRDLNELHHSYQKFPLIEDDDGYPCDDLNAITAWIKKTVDELVLSAEYNLVAINFSTYGATLVHLDEEGKSVTPLYNYLKAFPEEALKDFTTKYGLQSNDVETASPFLGMLNSGLKLYWLKYFKTELFSNIKTNLNFHK